MAGDYGHSFGWMLKACLISSLVFAGIFCYLYFGAPRISPSSSSGTGGGSSMSVIGTDSPIRDDTNRTDDKQPNGCGNPTFTVQEWTIANLPIAMAVIIFFGFFQPRSRLWPNCCSGRPSVAYPVNLLDSYSNRTAFLCAFGITALGILDLFTGNYYLEPNYNNIPLMVQGAVRTLMGYINVLAIGLAHYPIMVSLTVEKWIISDIIGLLYTLDWTFMYIYSLIECPWDSSEESRVNTLIKLPVYVCYCILIVLFIKRMRFNYKVKKKIRKGLEVEIHDYDEDFQKTHYYERVSYLFSSKEQWEAEHKEEDPGCCKKLLTKFYKPEPGFRFSRRIICTIGLSALCLYCVGIVYEASSAQLEKWAKDTFSLNGTLYEYYEGINSTGTFYRWKDAGDAFAYSFSPTAYAAMGTMIAYTLVFFSAYRRNTLRLWRGDRSFCPKEELKNVTLVVSSLKYSGYHVAFVIWGFVLLHLTLWLIVFLVIYLLILPFNYQEPNWVWYIIKNQWLTVIVYIVVYYSQVISAKFIFLQDRGKELSINNRRVFHVQVYFYLFLNVLIGLASCLYRIFKSVLFGLLLVGRIDRCLLMRGFELYDSGYKAYLGFLQLEVVHTHPVVVTFCHFLLKDLKEKKEKVLEFSEDEEVEIPAIKDRNPRPRIRWFLALTLLRNKHLLVERFNTIVEVKRLVHEEEIEKARAKREEEAVADAVKAFIDDSDDGGVGDEIDGDAITTESSSALARTTSKHTSSDDEERKKAEKKDGAPAPEDSRTGYTKTDESKDETEINSNSTSDDSKTHTGSVSDTVSTPSAPENAKTLSPPSSASTTNTTKDGESIDSGIQEKAPSSLGNGSPLNNALKNEVAGPMPSDVDITLPGTPTIT